MNRRDTMRHALAIAALALAGSVAATAVHAQGGAPLRLVVPFAAGTTTDIVGRLVGEAMGGALAQNVVVENKPGAGGTVGSDLVAKAAPDGATLLMGTVGTHAINPTLYRKLPYDALRDFVPVGFVGYTPTLLVVAAGSPLKTLADVKAQTAKPGGLTFASAGNGTSGHLAGELLGARLGGQMVHVPYNQGGQALTDVMSGQVGYMFYHPAAVLPHMKSGKLRAIGASSARRSAAAPDVPALQELGVADFDLVAWFMLYAPARTPEPVMARLREALQKALARPDVASKLAELGIEPRTLAPAELAAFAQAEVQRWAEGVKRSGAQVD